MFAAFVSGGLAGLLSASAHGLGRFKPEPFMRSATVFSAESSLSQVAKRPARAQAEATLDVFPSGVSPAGFAVSDAERAPDTGVGRPQDELALDIASTSTDTDRDRAAITNASTASAQANPTTLERASAATRGKTPSNRWRAKASGWTKRTEIVDPWSKR
jgi:hypothetical protein